MGGLCAVRGALCAEFYIVYCIDDNSRVLMLGEVVVSSLHTSLSQELVKNN